jgi:large subunit ribosomal protein L10
VIDAQAVEALAALPSREVLLAQLLQVMQGPISGLVNVLQGTLGSLVYALEAVRQKKEQEANA